MTSSQRLISGLIDIAQGFAKVITLGLVKGINWNYRYIKKYTLK